MKINKVKNSLFKDYAGSLFVIVVLAFAICCFNSCSIERNLAKEYVKQNERGTVMLLKPEYLYKKNLRNSSLTNVTGLDGENIDSILLSKSHFIRFIDDEVFFNSYFYILENSLSSYGFKVLKESEADSFLTAVAPAWVINPAQFEINEIEEPFSDFHYFDTVLFEQKFVLNKISLHSWLELSPLNPGEQTMDVLYSVQSVADKIEGRFKRHIIWGTVKYQYNKVPITLSHAYDISEHSAFKHSAYLFDFLMNNYIASQLPQWRTQNRYFSYDISKKRIKPYKEGFIIIK